jgi:2-dehydropantoate 2-reductase
MLFITTKATTLISAIERIDLNAIKNTAIIPLLNGISHIKILRKKFGKRVVASSISIESQCFDGNLIRHTSPFIKIKMSPDKEIKIITVKLISEFFKGVGIDAEVYETENEVLWEKLIRLNALACTTAASGLSIGEVRNDGFWRNRLRGAVDEAVKVALKHGFITDTNTVLKQLDGLPENLRSSMQRDVEAGRPAEIDAIPGAIVKLGAKHKIECPYTTGLIQDIKEKCRGFKQ